MSFEAGTYEIEALIKDGLLEIGDGYRAKNSELSETGIPFARAGNINDGFKFEGADCFPHADLYKVGNKISSPGDVVFTSKGTVGRFALVEAASQQFVYSPQLCFWRSLDHQRILPEYLYYWMNSQEFLNQIGYLKGQTDMADYVSLRDQRKMVATFPIPSHQREIVEAIKPLDDCITLLRETNATLEAIAQALFKSWFVDFDPVRAKMEGRVPEGMDEATAAPFPDGFEESALGLVPRGWPPIALYDLATYINGAAYKAFEPNLERRGLPIIKIAELKSGVTAQTAYSDVAMPEKYRIQTEDILFSWSGNPDTSIDTFVWTYDQAWLNQHIFRVLPHAAKERSFLLQTLKHLRPIFAELARNKQTTGLGHVTVADLKRLQVSKPDKAMLDQFDMVVSPIHGTIFNNHQQAQTLATLRDTLLPRLISGQLRLPEAEAQVEEAIA